MDPDTPQACACISAQTYNPIRLFGLSVFCYLAGNFRAPFLQSLRVALYTTDCSILGLARSLQGIVSYPEVTNLRCTVMLLSIVLSNLVCLLLPAFTSAHITTPEDPVNLAALHVKHLSTPLRNLLHKRDTILFASSLNASNALALNSTTGEIAETRSFEEEIDIPGAGRIVYFLVKGEIDEDYEITVEFWFHFILDKRIGVFHGDLNKGVDMKIPDSIKIINGEARLYVVASGEYDVLIFEAYGSYHIPHGPSKVFPDFKKEIKRWKVGNLESIQDIPNNSGVQTLSTDAGVDTSFSVE